MDTAITPVSWRRMLRFAYEKPFGLSTVSQAVALWQRQYQDPADYVPLIRPFAAQLAEHLAKPHLQSELALLLIAAFHAPAEALPADPSLTQGVSPVAPPVATPQAAQALKPAPSPSGVRNLQHSLSALYTALLEQLHTVHNGESICTQLKQHLSQQSSLAQCAIPQPHRSAWLLWVQLAPQQRLDIDVTIAQSQQFISVIYVYLVNVLGPVETDVLLSHAIQSVEQTDIGRVFSPRKLL